MLVERIIRRIMQMQVLVEVSRIIQKYFSQLIPFLLTGDLINTPPCAYHDPFQCKCTPRRRPSAPWLRGVPLALEVFFFVAIFMARDRKRNAGRLRILLGRWTMKMLRFTSHWAITSLKWSWGSVMEDWWMPVNVNFSSMHGMFREIGDVYMYNAAASKIRTFI